MEIGLYNRLKNKFSFIGGNLIVLIVSYMMFHFLGYLYSPFESLYIRELGASPFILGVMSSVGSTVFAFVRIPGAYISDHYGRKKIIAAMSYGVAFSYLFYALAADWRFVMFGMIILNFSHIYTPALLAMEVDSMHPDKRGMSYVAINTLPLLPSLIAAPIGGYIVEKMGLLSGIRVTYIIAAAGGFAVALIRTFYLKETLDAPRKIRLKELLAAFKESVNSIPETWRSMPRSLVYLTVALLMVSFESPFYQILLPLYANDVVGVRGFQWSIINTVFVATMLLSALPVGKIIDSIGRKKAILVSFLFWTPVNILFILSRRLTHLLIVMILFAVAQTLASPSFSAIKADLMPTDKRGRILGLTGMLQTLAMIPSATIGGLMYQINPASPFVLAVFLELTTILIIVFKVEEPS